MPFLRRKRVAEAFADDDPARAILNVTARTVREERARFWVVALLSLGLLLGMIYVTVQSNAVTNNTNAIRTVTRKADCARLVNADRDEHFAIFVQAIYSRDLAAQQTSSAALVNDAAHLRKCSRN